MRKTPFDCIRNRLSAELPAEYLQYLPDKWEKIGTVLTIRLPGEVREYKEIIAKAYAEVIGCSSVLNDQGGIVGVYREPRVEIVFGPSDTETIHTENGIRFKLDPQRIMFSSGNLSERLRMATASSHNETVVDLFAGIGYFTVPMAVYSKPKRIVACEINPLAYHYLCKNIVLNHVSGCVEPLFGDNRLVAPRDCANRVLLGYLNDSEKFLPVALTCLRNQAGFLHYHKRVASERFPDEPLGEVKKAASRFNRSVELLKSQVIKSYAPGIDHVVLDVRILI